MARIRFNLPKRFQLLKFEIQIQITMRIIIALPEPIILEIKNEELLLYFDHTEPESNSS